MFCMEGKWSVVSCVSCLNEMYDTSFCYPALHGGQVVSGGAAEFLKVPRMDDSEVAVFVYLLSFWCSLPELES
jgi:hypothetical protein